MVSYPESKIHWRLRFSDCLGAASPQLSSSASLIIAALSWWHFQVCSVSGSNGTMVAVLWRTQPCTVTARHWSSRQRKTYGLILVPWHPQLEFVYSSALFSRGLQISLIITPGAPHHGCWLAFCNQPPDADWVSCLLLGYSVKSISQCWVGKQSGRIFSNI